MKHPATWRPYISPTHTHYNTENFSYYLILRRTHWPTTKITCDVPGAELSHILLTWDAERSSCLSFRLKNKQTKNHKLYLNSRARHLLRKPGWRVGAWQVYPSLAGSRVAGATHVHICASDWCHKSWPRDTHIWIPITTFIQITLPSSKQIPSPRRDRVTCPSDIDATSGKSGHTALLIPYSQMATKENKAKRYLSMQAKRLASMWPATGRQHQCVLWLFSACVLHMYMYVHM